MRKTENTLRYTADNDPVYKLEISRGVRDSIRCGVFKCTLLEIALLYALLSGIYRRQ